MKLNTYPKVKLWDLIFFERPTKRRWWEWVEKKDNKNIYRFFKSTKNIYYTDKYDFDWEYIILSNRWPLINISYINWKFWASDILFVFNNRTDLGEKSINLKFLYYYLLSIQNDLDKLRFGATSPILRRTDLNNIDLHLPPLEEQFIITNYLDKQYNSLNDIKNNIEKYQELLLNLENWLLQYELWEQEKNNLIVNIDKISELNKQNIFELNKIKLYKLSKKWKSCF